MTYSVLDILANLVVELKLLINVLVNVGCIIIIGRRRRLEEVEERFRWYDLLDCSRLVGVCDLEVMNGTKSAFVHQALRTER